MRSRREPESAALPSTGVIARPITILIVRHGYHRSSHEIKRLGRSPCRYLIRRRNRDTHVIASPLISVYLGGVSCTRTRPLLFAILAGILILVRPALLNYIVALYLIIIGVLGLMR